MMNKEQAVEELRKLTSLTVCAKEELWAHVSNGDRQDRVVYVVTIFLREDSCLTQNSCISFEDAIQLLTDELNQGCFK